MPAALAFAQIGVQLLPVIETGAEELISYISKVRTAARQTGEWPDATEQAFRAGLVAHGKDPAYLLD